MTPKHHPSDALLISHAGGGLGEGLALAVATHLSMCPMCRDRLRAAEAAGGALLDEIEPMALSSGSLDATLSALDRVGMPRMPSRAHAAETKPMAGQFQGTTLPGPLSDYIDGMADPKWRWMAPGIRQVELQPRNVAGGSARLFRIGPGRTQPHHGHSGIELTVVLSGSFTDETGRFGPGDLAELDEETQHQPISDSHEDCICLIATEAPLRFTGLVGRMLQPIVRL